MRLLGGSDGAATALVAEPPPANPHERFGAVLARIATATSVLRTRREDAVRASYGNAEWEARVSRAVERLEKVADELEKALA
jgi:hypothetical protein